MKKIITASILSLILLGVGSANADGDAHTWEFEKDVFYETPIEDCFEASKKGMSINAKYESDKYYFYDDKLFYIELWMAGGLYPYKIKCSSASPKSVIK